jgi:hypothetical protein
LRAIAAGGLAIGALPMIDTPGGAHYDSHDQGNQHGNGARRHIKIPDTAGKSGDWHVFTNYTTVTEKLPAKRFRQKFHGCCGTLAGLGT